MDYLIYFGLFAFQLTSALATQPVPLKCFLQDYYFLDIFGRSDALASPYKVFSINPLRLDTFKVDSIKLDQDGLLLDAEDIEFQGLKDAILDDFGFNLNSNISRITFHTDLFSTCLYKAAGSLFYRPINGEGFCIASLKNIQVNMVMPFDMVSDVNGKKFIDIQNFNYWYDVKDNAEFNFSNLYNGNKELSDSMHYLINQNWKFITVQFGKVFMDKIVGHVFNVFRNYLLAMPLRDFDTC